MCCAGVYWLCTGPTRRSESFRHTPHSVEEKRPWKCQRLVIGTGTGALPVMKEVRQEAKRRKIELLVLPTTKAIAALKKSPDETNAIPGLCYREVHRCLHPHA